MKRCYQCGKPFGLIRHYHYFRQFCSVRCKQRFLHAQVQEVARRRTAAARLTGLAESLRARKFV
jgi:hypothetical protein